MVHIIDVKVSFALFSVPVAPQMEQKRVGLSPNALFYGRMKQESAPYVESR